MHINIAPSETEDNKGSSGALVHYVEKENISIQDLRLQERWFNGKSGTIKPYEVCIGSESNVAKLGKDGNKFFLINISPSKKDFAHLIVAYGEQGTKERLN